MRRWTHLGRKLSAVCLAVDVAASAGVLAALKALVRTLPTDARLAIVIIPHLDPKHE